jgi:hypothetical protein
MPDNFKQYLEEARMADLYHGTSPYNCYQILMKNSMVGFGSVKPAISFSRRQKTARLFGPCVIIMNQRKLSQRYKIVPYNYWANYSNNTFTRLSGDDFGKDPYTKNEYEETVLAKEIKPFDKYVKQIIIDEKRVDKKLLEYIKNFCELRRIPLEI